MLTVADLLAAAPVTPLDTDGRDVALMQLTSGSTGSPKAVQITHDNLVSNAEAMFVGAKFDMENDVIVSWLPLFHDMGMIGYLTVPMYFGAELVKVIPMDFLRDILLWARLIDKYKLHEEYKTVIAREIKNGEIIPQPKKEEPTPKMKLIAQYVWDSDKEDWVLKKKA